MVSFELGEELKFFVLSRAWDKESNLRPSDLRSEALPLSHRDSSVSEVYYEVHMTRVLDDAYHMNFAIRRSDVRFLMRTQNFFFVPRS